MKSKAHTIGCAETLLFAGIMVIGISGCTSSYVPPPNAVDMDPAHWSLLWGTGTPPHPAPSQPGWQFQIPAAPGSVHYVQVPFNVTEDLTGKTLTITFRVVSNNSEYNANVETGESGPPSFHLFIEHRDDDFSNPFYRWWCGAGAYMLGTQDNQTITLSCPLTYTSWSSVYNVVDQAQFTSTLNHLGGVGVTFGGRGGWGHGVNLLGGSAQFQLLDASIGDSEQPAVRVSPNQ